jgi:hypothetical protein
MNLRSRLHAETLKPASAPAPYTASCGTAEVLDYRSADSVRPLET